MRSSKLLMLELQGFSVKEPDVIVSTPAALLNYLYAIDPEKHRRADFIRGVKFVVIIVIRWCCITLALYISWFADVFLPQYICRFSMKPTCFCVGVFRTK